MTSKNVVVFPWQRVGAYFSLDTVVFGPGLLNGHWTKSTEDVNNDGVPEVTTVRTRDGHGRLTKIEVVDTRDASKNKVVVLTYDTHGRVEAYDYQATVRPHTTSYVYDDRDHLVKESSVTTDLQGGRHTAIASHIFNSHGAISSTHVTDDLGRKREDRRYTSRGEIASMVTYDDAGNVFAEDESIFDGHHRLILMRNRRFFTDSVTGKSRMIAETTEETIYQGGSDLRASVHRLEFNEFEDSPGVFVLLKANEETTTFPPASGGVQHFESRTFTPVVGGAPVETSIRVEDTTFDANGRQIAMKGTNTNLNTGESKAVRTVTAYRTIVVTTTDIGDDGADDEESVVISDEFDRIVESREGKPDGGEFTKRQKLTYNANGELSKRVTFENNSTIPSSVVTYS